MKDLLEKIMKALGEHKIEFDFGAEVQKVIDTAVEAVNNKNSELLTKLKDAKKLSDGIPEGFTEERWNELLKAEQDLANGKLKGDEAVQAVTKQLNDAHQVELTKMGEKNTKLQGALEKQLVDNAVSEAITGLKGNPTLLLPHVRNSVKVVEEEGEYKAIVVDPNGNQRFSMKDAGEHMGLDELVGEYKTKDTFAAAFAADNSGGGAGGDGKAGSKNPFMKGANFSITEQARMANATPEIAKQMQTEATAAAAAQ